MQIGVGLKCHFELFSGLFVQVVVNTITKCHYQTQQEPHKEKIHEWLHSHFFQCFNSITTLSTLYECMWLFSRKCCNTAICSNELLTNKSANVNNSVFASLRIKQWGANCAEKVEKKFPSICPCLCLQIGILDSLNINVSLNDDYGSVSARTVLIKWLILRVERQTIFDWSPLGLARAWSLQTNIQIQRYGHQREETRAYFHIA